jgi:hypothetical protein
MTRMIEDGLLPAISVHFVDEGVDTGPLVLRQTIDPKHFNDVANIDNVIYAYQAKGFKRALEILEATGDRSCTIDTFLEPSRMTRGVTAERVAVAYNSMYRNHQLRPADQAS